jgi:hypothetical protein
VSEVKRSELRVVDKRLKGAEESIVRLRRALSIFKDSKERGDPMPGSHSKGA